VAAPSQRRVLGALFLFLAVFFIGIAAAVIGLWIGTFGLRALLVRRAR